MLLPASKSPSSTNASLGASKERRGVTSRATIGNSYDWNKHPHSNFGNAIHRFTKNLTCLVPFLPAIKATPPCCYPWSETEMTRRNQRLLSHVFWWRPPRATGLLSAFSMLWGGCWGGAGSIFGRAYGTFCPFFDHAPTCGVDKVLRFAVNLFFQSRYDS